MQFHRPLVWYLQKITLGSNRVCRRRFSLPSVLLCLIKSWMGGYYWCNHLQSDYYFSWDPQVDVVFRSFLLWKVGSCLLGKGQYRNCLKIMHRSQFSDHMYFQLDGNWWVLTMNGFIILQCDFHPKPRVHPNRQSMSGKNVILLNQNVSNCLLFRFSKQCFRAIKSFKELPLRFCFTLWVQFFFFLQFMYFSEDPCPHWEAILNFARSFRRRRTKCVAPLF